MSHKFLGGGYSPDQLAESIANLDNTINSAESWFITGIFDFAEDPNLDKYIHHFQIRIRNFSSSYMAIEMRLNLKVEFQDEMNEFLHDNSEIRKPCLTPFWQRNSKKCGGKIGYGVGLTPGLDKSIILNEQLQHIKNLFLKKINKFIPLFQYSHGKKLFSVNVFKTDLDIRNNISNYQLDRMGLDEHYGFFLSEAERLYCGTRLEAPVIKEDSDLIYVYNPEKIGIGPGLCTPENTALYQLTHEYMDKMYQFLIIRNLGVNYANGISIFRNGVNRLKSNKNAHKQLLKIKYNIEKEYYTYEKIDKEISVEKLIKEVHEYLDRNEYARRSVVFPMYVNRAYRYFTTAPQRTWELVDINYTELLRNLENKISVAASLNNYYDVRKNYIISGIQMVLAIITFILLLFPDKAAVLAALIVDWVKFLREHIINIGHDFVLICQQLFTK